MDSHLRPDDEGVRLSNSPRRSPVITHALTSPVRSVLPVMQGLDSIHSQPDFGLRTADFFEDTSEDESAILPAPGGDAQDVELLERRGLGSKKPQSLAGSQTLASRCEPKRASLPPDEGYQRLAANPGLADTSRFTDTPGTSFHGSVDELLPVEERSSPPRFPRPAHVRSGRTPCSSAQIEDVDEHQTPMPSSKVDQILGAHAIAHEITLQALMRDEEALDRSLQSFAPLNSEYRASLLPASLRVHDPRSPRNQTFASPQSASSKKVHVVPPPIDTSAPRRSLPADLVRTPYPTTPDRVHRKDFQRSAPSATVSPPATTESVLTLSIRRANAHSLPRVTTIIIPASNDFSAIRSRSVGENERHFKALDFDDEDFFRQLWICYRKLSGPMLLLSARSLRRIAVSGPASKAADAGYGWLHQPRSPPVLAYRGLSDTFNEEKILQHYRKPTLGRSRYAFVHWAHRLAAAPPIRTPQVDDDVQETVDRDLVRRMEQPEGLEFVVSWSILRIMLVVGGILALSIAAALLWIFLGRNTVSGGLPHGGFKDAGDRVGPGILIGVCVLLVGFTGMAGWVGVSWLVI